MVSPQHQFFRCIEWPGQKQNTHLHLIRCFNPRLVVIGLSPSTIFWIGVQILWSSLGYYDYSNRIHDFRCSWGGGWRSHREHSHGHRTGHGWTRLDSGNWLACDLSDQNVPALHYARTLINLLGEACAPPNSPINLVRILFTLCHPLRRVAVSSNMRAIFYRRHLNLHFQW